MISFNNKIVQSDLEEIVYKSGVNFSNLRNKTVLITGASGMLATYIVYVIGYLNIKEQYNTKIIGTVRNLEKANLKFSDFPRENFELIHQDVVVPFKYDGPIDYIIHAASNASPHFITADPVGIVKANVIGTINLLDFAKNNPIKNFLFLSTREIYGKAINASLTEEDYGAFDILASRACYPESKRMAETILKSYKIQYGIPFSIARIAHTYGPGMQLDSDGRIMNDLISNVINFENITLKSDGSSKRAFCYLSDAIVALFLILFKGKNGAAYNVTNEDEPVKIRDLAQKLVRLFPEKQLKVKFDIPKVLNAAYSAEGRTVMNTNKIEKLGWERKVSLDFGLKKTVESFK